MPVPWILVAGHLPSDGAAASSPQIPSAGWDLKNQHFLDCKVLLRQTGSKRGLTQELLPQRAFRSFFASTSSTVVVPRRFRFRFLLNRVARWLVPLWRCLTFPLLLRRKRFFVPLWVFCLGITLNQPDVTSVSESEPVIIDSPVFCKRGIGQEPCGGREFAPDPTFWVASKAAIDECTAGIVVARQELLVRVPSSSCRTPQDEGARFPQGIGRTTPKMYRQILRASGTRWRYSLIACGRHNDQTAAVPTSAPACT